MGWGSGTSLFDRAVDAFFELNDNEEDRKTFIFKMWDAFSDSDWDTEDESKYYDYLAPIIEQYYRNR